MRLFIICSMGALMMAAARCAASWLRWRDFRCRARIRDACRRVSDGWSPRLISFADYARERDASLRVHYCHFDMMAMIFSPGWSLPSVFRRTYAHGDAIDARRPLVVIIVWPVIIDGDAYFFGRDSPSRFAPISQRARCSRALDDE